MSEIYSRLASNTDLTLLLTFMQQFYAIDQYDFDEDIARATLTLKYQSYETPLECR
jgi:hypothetical protein